MPWLAAHPCRYSGCGTLLRGRYGFCREHARLARQRIDKGRPSASARGYDRRWDGRRRAYLEDHPTCERPGCGRPATVVDHRLPLREGGPDDESNYQALCKLCHDSWKQRIDRRRANSR